MSSLNTAIPASTNLIPASRPWLNRAALRHWTFHVCVSAAPSFAISVAIGPEPSRVLGMVLGVLFFIALYTLAARWTFPNETELPLWRRAIRLGTWIRTISAILFWGDISLRFLFGRNPLQFLFMPDLYAGFLAHTAVEKLAELVRGAATGLDFFGTVIFTFLVTIIEGFILSGLIFAIALVCLLNLKLRARRDKSTQLGKGG